MASYLANISGMSTGLPPPLQLPGPQGGLRPPAIKEENVLPLPCLGLLPRSQGLALLPFLPVALSASLLPHLPLPLLLGIGSLRFPSSPAGRLYNHLMLSSEKEGASARATNILKVALSPEDRRLMSSLSSEDLDRMLTLVLAKGKILSRPPGESSQAQGDVHMRKLEGRVERLLGEVAKVKDSRKVAVGRYQQAEREVKKLQREVKALKKDHAEELQTVANQIWKRIPQYRGRKELPGGLLGQPPCFI
ncbi:UNVERIFIED_CONTAM: hypothetical protein Slati_1920800 [Sesamum latifolium]|uniref:Uncharacterized protein n=1 Tax=Sesamum latifolium TaxID=2727402 RepID=A0AAW2X3T8_9LAMI